MSAPGTMSVPSTAPETEDSQPSYNVELLNLLQTIINCYLVQVTALVGAVGNLLTTIILFRFGFRDTSNIILISLAGVDVFYLVNLSLRKMACIVSISSPALAERYQVYTLTYVYLYGRLSMVISVTHIVVISTERLLAVFYPLHVSRWVTQKSVTVVLLCVYAAWTGAILPYLISYRNIEWVFQVQYNTTHPVAVLTAWFQENRAVLTLYAYIVLNSITGAFCVVVALQCCAIVYKLRLLAKQRLTLTSSSKQPFDLKVSRMLLVVCVVYCFCNIPSFVIYICYYLVPITSQGTELNVFLRDLEEFLIALNSAADFFIYTLMSAKFYNSVRNLFRCFNSSDYHKNPKTVSSLITQFH